MRILDLFCGAGGAAMGLHQAFPDAEIVGVDIRPQPRYPFVFVQADAMTFPLDGFDFIWASPPCQGYSRMRHLPWLKGKAYPLLIDPIRERLLASGAEWIIENVEDAPLRSGTTLCGTMFGLKVYRHRKFEASFMVLAPLHLRHVEVIGRGRLLNDRAGASENGWVSLPSKVRLNKPSVAGGFVQAAGHQAPKSLVADALGVDWMSKAELSQAIPPAFSRYLAQFIPLEREAAA